MIICINARVPGLLTRTKGDFDIKGSALNWWILLRLTFHNLSKKSVFISLNKRLSFWKEKNFEKLVSA
ncbi:MAG: hypothetical protein DWQ02_10210 [Bacteroidetes bacterium]|nr:MAG: hypothetical protein DWQ02_10210 [Bacteroidota bacterium]